jgi:hypothetical protein
VKTLDQAREARIDAQLDADIAKKLKGISLEKVSPTARIKLRNILKKYARSAHPFRDCVRDNMKRFGPGRTEAVCATLKDQIKGNTKWRKGGAKMGEGDLVIDADVLLALNAISDIDLEEIFLEMRALDEHGTTEAAALLDVKGETELKRWGVGQIALAEMESADV